MSNISNRELGAVARIMQAKQEQARSAEQIAFDQFTKPLRDKIAFHTAELAKAQQEYTSLGGFPYWLR